MTALFPLLAVGGGAALALSKGQTPEQGKEVTAGAATETKPTLGAGMRAGATIQQLTAVGTTSSLKARYLTGVKQIATAPLMSSSSPGSMVETYTQEQLDVIAKYGKAAYDSLSTEAKKKGAAEMSKLLKLDPPLTGDEDWETIAKIAGGAAGVAAFGWLPGGAVWGPIVGSYLGIKIEELLSKSTDDIKNWFTSQWGDIEDTVSDGAKAVGHFFGSIF